MDIKVDLKRKATILPKSKETEKFAKLIEANSIFNRDVIGRVLADLYSILIGKKAYYRYIKFPEIGGMFLFTTGDVTTNYYDVDYDFLIFHRNAESVELRDFIDYVIEYRIKHQEELKGEISEEKLVELEYAFLELKRRQELESNILRRKNILKNLYKK